MNKNDLLPSFSDFRNLVDSSFTDEKENEFQLKTIKQLGYESYDVYLKEVYSLYSTSFDLQKIFNEALSKLSDDKQVVLSVPKLVAGAAMNLNHTRIKSFSKKIDTLPIKIRKRFAAILGRKMTIFLHLFVEKSIAGDSVKYELITAVNEDTKNQYATLNTVQSKNKQGSFSMQESVALPKVNAIIKRYTTTNYYFWENVHLLKRLQELLFEEGFIEQHDSFELVFQNEKIDPSKTQPIKWKSKNSKTSLFYLLFILSNKVGQQHGKLIPEIAFNLFQFEKPVSLNSLKTNYNEICRRFNDQNYVSRNMKKISKVIQELGLS
ncbi:MAG: hypothetical protein IPO32_12215 [Crocinitomicaceae bacterium]|nr:hypothetical protein [Crocinitomicaceae bacterium]